MDSASIELPGSEITAIWLGDDGTLRIVFSKALIIKTMTGSSERTRWWQAGALVLEKATVEEDSQDLPCEPMVCVGGDIEDNVFTYRDMIPLPLASRGRVGCDLGFHDSTYRLRARGSAIRLEMVEVAKYIEHIRPN